MFNKIGYKIQRYGSIFKEIKNWPSYLAFKMGIHPGKQFTFHFNDGHQYTVPKKMIGPFRECFFDDQYMQKFDDKTFTPFPVIIDIGANVGYAALCFFRKFPQAVVHSFEPMPFLQSVLRKHGEEHRQYQWKIHPYGLWKEEGELELFTTSTDDFTSVSGVMKFPDSDKTMQVKVKRLDQFMEEHEIETIDLLKLDCEGAEYEILFSLSDHAYSKVKRIAMETHVTENNTTEDLVAFLRNKGFTVTFTTKTVTGHIWAWK